MKEPYFWATIILHFLTLGLAVHTNPNYIMFTFLTFYLIPQTTETRHIPGMKQVFENHKTQYQTLKQIQ